MEPKEVQALLKGQAEIWQHLFGFVDSMALKCAVELRIADIIHSHGGPITLCQIASGIINSPSLDIPYLCMYHEITSPQKYLNRTSSIKRWGDSLWVDPSFKMAFA